MMNPNYRRSVEELKEVASMFWPSELSDKAATLSIIPKLLETQEQFISILNVDVSTLEGFFQVIDAATLTASLFLKHLMVLADVGAEKIDRWNSQFKLLFASQNLKYFWKNQEFVYEFNRLPLPGKINNRRLGISGKKLFENRKLDDLSQDVIAILLFGAYLDNERTSSILKKCKISDYIGQPEKLNAFIKQRYIWVSQITGGAKANDLGQIAQSFVKNYIEDKFKDSEFSDLTFNLNGSVPGVTHTDDKTNRPTSFDLVVAYQNKYIAVEVSFQETTNSVIERKAGQAKSRFEQIERMNYKIAYVLDGAGNFQRENALKTICSHSHCSVAFSPTEIDVLYQFIFNYFNLQ